MTIKENEPGEYNFTHHGYNGFKNTVEVEKRDILEFYGDLMAHGASGGTFVTEVSDDEFEYKFVYAGDMFFRAMLCMSSILEGSTYSTA